MPEMKPTIIDDDLVEKRWNEQEWRRAVAKILRRFGLSPELCIKPLAYKYLSTTWMVYVRLGSH